VPELPEVESWRRLAAQTLVGKRIEEIHTSPDPIVYDGVSPRRFAAALEGCRVLAASRRGKQLWLETDRRPWPLFHFGMTGALVRYSTPTERPRFWKLEMVAEGGIRVAYLNTRRLGRLRLRENPLLEPPVSLLGRDPLLDLPSRGELRDLLGARRVAIKAALLDQRLFAGVGNWIADEVLFQAAIRPSRRCCDLQPGEIDRLRRRLKGVITRAVAVDADSSRFPKDWLFHVRWGKSTGAVTTGGHRLRFDTIGGRTTAWVPAVQH
jgi:formamidopyrimidine-DNA glycosylase